MQNRTFQSFFWYKYDRWRPFGHQPLSCTDFLNNIYLFAIKLPLLGKITVWADRTSGVSGGLSVERYLATVIGLWWPSPMNYYVFLNFKNGVSFHLSVRKSNRLHLLFLLYDFILLFDFIMALWKLNFRLSILENLDSMNGMVTTVFRVRSKPKWW